jgi:hypothetical protein
MSIGYSKIPSINGASVSISGSVASEVTGFVTTASVAAGATYDSGYLDAAGYSQVQTEILSDKDGTINIQFCADAAGADVVRSLTIPYVAANGYQFFAAPAFVNYIRYRFTNDEGADTTDFYYTTKFLTTALSPQLLTTNAFISPAMVATLNRNIIVGQDPQGTFRNSSVDYDGTLKVNINEPQTAFGDLRNAELTPQVQVTFPYNLNGDLVFSSGSNGGVATQGNSMAVISSSIDPSGSAEIKTLRILKYRAGLGAIARFTTLYETSSANSTQIHGCGNGEDGFFFGYNGTQFGTLIRKNSVDTWTAQSSWSEDVLDGTGPSKMTLDHTKLNVYAIEYQWLGAGEIDFKVEDQETGKLLDVHRVKFANSDTEPSTFNPSFPIEMKITKTGGAEDIRMKSASMSGFVEGKNIILGPVNNVTGSTTATAETAVFNLRNKTSYTGKTNRVRAYLRNLSIANDKNQLATITIYRNATLGGVASYSDINGDDSIMEVDTAQTYSSGGKNLFSTTVAKDSGGHFDFGEEEFQIVPGDVITVTIDSSGAGTAKSTMSWIEDF